MKKKLIFTKGGFTHRPKICEKMELLADIQKEFVRKIESENVAKRPDMERLDNGDLVARWDSMFFAKVSMSGKVELTVIYKSRLQSHSQFDTIHDAIPAIVKRYAIFINRS